MPRVKVNLPNFICKIKKVIQRLFNQIIAKFFTFFSDEGSLIYVLDALVKIHTS